MDHAVKLRRIREIFNYKQEYVAYRLSINQATYSRIERGKKELSLSLLIRLTELYGISVPDFIEKTSKELEKEAFLNLGFRRN